MARTRTPGIRVDHDGRRIIDKDYRGVTIYVRLGAISQEHAEQRLGDEIARANAELERNTRPRRRFVDCAGRYIAESRNKRSVGASAWHVRLLTHDGTLERFVADRVASGVTATTINRSLEVVRVTLNRAARSHRDDAGRPLLETVPPLITMLPERRDRPTPSLGTSKTGSFPSCPHVLAGWCSLL